MLGVMRTLSCHESMPDAEIGFIARSEFYNNDALDYIVSSFHIVSASSRV